jgi:hypothetical protein
MMRSREPMSIFTRKYLFKTFFQKSYTPASFELFLDSDFSIILRSNYLLSQLSKYTVKIMKSVRYRHGYATTLTSSSGNHIMPVMFNNKWSMAECIGFTESIEGLLVAVSDVLFFLDDEMRQTPVDSLVLGVVTEEDRFMFVLHNNKLIKLPGDKYAWPKYVDQPKATVTSIGRNSKHRLPSTKTTK